MFGRPVNFMAGIPRMLAGGAGLVTGDYSKFPVRQAYCQADRVSDRATSLQTHCPGSEALRMPGLWLNPTGREELDLWLADFAWVGGCRSH